MYRRILVPLDGSKLAEAVLPHVEELAGGKGLEEIVLLRICSPPTVLADYPAGMPVTWEERKKQIITGMQTECSLYLGGIEETLRQHGFKVRTESRLGDPATEIVGFAENNDIDMIVMASHGRSGVSRWAYGSVAEKVLHSTCIPVLMVKAPGCTVSI